jgi:hypothetical protein
LNLEMRRKSSVNLRLLATRLTLALAHDRNRTESAQLTNAAVPT